MKHKNKIFIILTITLIIFVVIATIIKINQTSEYNNESLINKNAQLSDIEFIEGKVNIYFFWGNGCPHCEDEFSFLEKLSEEYSKDINIYSFEVWNNQDNTQILTDFARIMQKQVTGVPFTIIGEESFSGFSTSIEDNFKNAIKKQINNDFDVYKEYKQN
ncbi:MAG: thioredoxin family protein [Bacilli bacterium]|nr:thioredoxin family protein [Bacilli bacterium]